MDEFPKFFFKFSVCTAIKIHLVYGRKSKSKPGSLLLMLCMQKVVYSSVKFGMLDEFQMKVFVLTHHGLSDILKVHLSHFRKIADHPFYGSLETTSLLVYGRSEAVHIFTSQYLALVRLRLGAGCCLSLVLY